MSQIIHKKKRNKFTYKEKQDVIKNYELSGLNVLQFSKLINIKQQTLQDWITNKKKILSIEKKQLKSKKIGSGNRQKLPLIIELEIVKWFLDVRQTGIPISDELIKIRGKFLLKHHNSDIIFEFSNGWLDKFKNKYNIRKRKGGSTIVRIADDDLNKIKLFIKEIKDKIKSNEYDAIINIDETGIYYDSHINYTLEIGNKKRVEIISTGREQQRTTVILGIDLLNNITINPFIILKGKTNRCLKDVKKSENYNLSYQTNSWCTDDQFIKFISTFPNNKKILLLFDNFRGHKTEKVNKFFKDKYPLIEVQTLPPNTTSILQPLDVGINKPFKTFIKKKYISWLENNFDYKKNIQSIKKKGRTNLLIDRMSDSWRKITIETITNAFKFCGYVDDDNVTPKWEKYCSIL